MSKQKSMLCMPGWLLAVALCLSLHAYAEDAPPAQPPAKPALLPRLLAKLEVEPLLALCAENVQELPEKFAHTHFSKMLQEPSYGEGRNYLRALINHHAGADVAALWPDFSRQLRGPAVLAMLPNAKKAAGDPDFMLVLAVVVETPENVQQLQAHWPKVPPQSESLLAALRLLPILEKDLPPAESVPAWAKPESWPAGDVSLRGMPHKLGETLTPFLEKGASEGLQFLALGLKAIRDEDVEHLGFGITFAGEMFSEELQLEVNPARKDAFIHVVETVRDKPAPWDAVLAATPGDQDLIFLSQCNFNALETDLPFATQALERYLRGKRWSRSKGRQPEALDAERFKFLLQRAQGSFGIVSRPTPTGDLRMTVVTALKNDTPAGAPADPMDVETLRAELTKGLSGIGAEFDTLQNARKIGAVAPLGALFQGRGMFGTPVIGLSPGWLWLCSGTAAYQDLTTAFKTRRTLALEMGRRPDDAAAPKKPELWRTGDASRLQIDLEKVLKLAYAAWLLSGAEGPFVGPWKVPGALLPQPAMFNGHLGTLRTGLARQKNVLTAYATCSLPLCSFLLPTLLQEAADTIENTRTETKHAQLEEKALNEDPPVSQPSAAKSPEKDEKK